MEATKHKELAILLVGTLAASSPTFAKDGSDDNSSSSSSVSSSSSSSCSSGSSSGRCKRAYTVSGVISSGTGLETAFTCTNMEKSKSALLSVSVFSSVGDPLNDNTPSNGVVVVDAGATETLATANIASLGATPIALAGSVVPPGAASITSTTSKMVCNAYIVSGGSPVMPLPLVKGSNRKGD